MTPSKHRASVEMEVPFHDVDALHRVWHGHYYKYLEIARTALFRDLGMTVEVARALPYTWVVIETRCRYSHPLRMGERFRVDAWLKDVDHRVNVAYEIVTAGGERAARAHTVLATLDSNGELLINTPDRLLDYLADR